LIRFFHLSSPCLWYDEARVYYRVCGTYGQLLDCLRTDGFVPLHYEMYWVMVRSISGFPGPTIMRLIPAICGTLMVPAIYFLARQLLPIRTSLLAAGFTACSAFLIFYSRDSKMYMDAWLLVTVGMASLLWWFRTDRSTAWLCWIASTAAACGVHATSLIALPLSLLFLLTQHSLRWQKAIMFFVGVGIITAGPIGYYEKFNTWKDRVDEDWRYSELEWIKIYNIHRGGPELTRYLGTSMLMAWEWPRASIQPTIQPVRVNVPIALFSILIAMLIAGAIPWPHHWRGNPGLEPPPQPRWRAVFWLTAWLVVPTYCFYCRSITNFASPLDWLAWLADLLPADVLDLLRDHQWPWAGLGIAAGAVIIAMISRPMSRSLLTRGFELLAVFAGVFAVLWGIYEAAAPAAQAAAVAGKPWESVWVPRYLGVIWPALALIVAALLMRLPTKPVRISAIAIFFAINLFFGGARIFAQTEPPVQQMATDAVDAKDLANHTLLWTNLSMAQRAPGGGTLPGECGMYYIQSLEHSPMSPEIFKTETRQLVRQYTSIFPLPLNFDIPANARRMIVWNQYGPTQGPSIFERALPDWKLKSDTTCTVRDFWTWQDLAKYRRREYVRTGAP
jgi:hypothetical protein